MDQVFALPSDRYLRTPLRYLWWLVVCQRWRIVAGATLGTVWMVGLALPPYLLSRAIDSGLETHDTGALVLWASLLLFAAAANALIGMLRHRTMTRIRMDASFRTSWSVVRHSTVLGSALTRHMTAGEVVAIGMGDVQAVSQVLTITGPGVGAVVAYLVVALLLLAVSPLLAAVVLAGVPLIACTIGPLVNRLEAVGDGYRTRQGALTGRLVDIVAGLRVLNGLGGKDVHAERYRRDSRALQDEGYRVGAVTSWLDALGTGLPLLFLAAVTWLAARMAAEGSITVGQLVAVYGYVAVLQVPVGSFIEGASDYGRAVVAARRVIRFLSLEPDHVDAAAEVDLHDHVSGVAARPGVLTALVGARPSESEAIIDRLGGLSASNAGIRERVLIADNDADLFAGTVREVVIGRGEAYDERVWAAIRAAAALDVVEALSDGLDSEIASQGRNLSGGQRQRLRLARALYAVPEVMLAGEPTSAVDAHTEAAMISGLRAAREGLTTLVTTTSPLVLDQADTVVFVVDGKVAATGSHSELLRTEDAYRALVVRDPDVEISR